jgi:hypothetical protein
METCRMCGETPDQHIESKCPPDYDTCYTHPYATTVNGE